MSFQVETTNNVDNNNAPNNEAPFFQVGDRSFKTREDLEHHIQSAQNHIKKLESDFENATKLISTQDQALSTSSRIEDLLNAVANKQSTSSTAEETPKFSKEDVIAEALQSFEQRQVELSKRQQEEQNYSIVAQTLTAAYGNKTNEVVQKVAGENGMTYQEAEEYARRYPKAFLKMFDTKNISDARPNFSSVNTNTFANTPSERPKKSIMQMTVRERAAEVQRRLAELQ
jgi:hypothetical protein